MDTQVLIVGGGPVGLTLAIDLGRRGVTCALIEKNEQPLFFPKMERCNPRTMEIFRRLGLADSIREAGYPEDWPMDVYLVLNMMKPPVFQMHYPTVKQGKATRDAVNDGTIPLEPSQIISQYTLEPLLKREAERTPNLTVLFGHEFVSLSQNDDGVSATVKRSDGQQVVINAKYLVGCDGGASRVRQEIGVVMEGRPNVKEMRQALFYCPEFFEKVTVPRARHYHRIDDHWTFVIVQDSRKHFTLHAVVDKDEDMAPLFEEFLGTSLDYELLSVNKWTQRLMIANHYRNGRVFLAGDACHLVIPTGGLGFNTGCGDAIDISWKLAATLQGWGGPALLDSYESERRQVGARNVAASERGTEGRMKWRDAYDPIIQTDTPEGCAALARVLDIAKAEAPKTLSVIGVECGYRYVDSAIICNETGGPEHNIDRYIPSTWPGARLPHVWLEAGKVSVNDRIGDGYTLLRVGDSKSDASELQEAFRSAGAKLSIIDIDLDAARKVYGYDYLLVRPDLHVVWRGNTLPNNAKAVARTATGH